MEDTQPDRNIIAKDSAATKPEAGFDLESNGGSAHLVNDAVRHFSWKDLTVQIKDRKTKKTLPILEKAHGIVHAGEMLAIMGPSGSGKTTLLNALAHRKAAASATTAGDVMANGRKIGLQTIRQLSSYVEQEDALIGSLTVQETMKVAANLALSGRISRKNRMDRVNELISSFGLLEKTHTIVGTPIKKGLSGGQKKRLGVASRLVTDPKILFLDEPTSGLDSTISFQVMSFIKDIAKKNNLLVIASIHQPSTSTYNLFDKLCLLSKGKLCYFGSLPDAQPYFRSIGFSMPTAINPAEFQMDLVNTDLAQEGDETFRRMNRITTAWTESEANQGLCEEIDENSRSSQKEGDLADLSWMKDRKPNTLIMSIVLLQRAWIKAHRDIVAYGIRVVMYLGLAILMGTVFLRFSTSQKYIQPFINAIFFGSAFMSFMAVAYVPAFLEDRATFAKERADGLVGPFAFLLSNFIIGLPFLFLIAFLFAIIAYFLSNFRSDGTAFFMFTMWLFLDLLAAESLVVLVSVLIPIFVVALAIAAFANGLWMCVGGFLVPMSILNPFWKYVFHYIDYQAYVFQGMMVNEFKSRRYDCDRLGDGFQCMYPSEPNAPGKVAGSAVLSALKIPQDQEKEWVGIMIAIIAVYRILAYIVLRLKER